MAVLARHSPERAKRPQGEQSRATHRFFWLEGMPWTRIPMQAGNALQCVSKSLLISPEFLVNYHCELQKCPQSRAMAGSAPPAHGKTAVPPRMKQWCSAWFCRKERIINHSSNHWRKHMKNFRPKSASSEAFCCWHNCFHRNHTKNGFHSPLGLILLLLPSFFPEPRPQGWLQRPFQTAFLLLWSHPCSASATAGSSVLFPRALSTQHFHRPVTAVGEGRITFPCWTREKNEQGLRLSNLYKEKKGEWKFSLEQKWRADFSSTESRAGKLPSSRRAAACLHLNLHCSSSDKCTAHLKTWQHALRVCSTSWNTTSTAQRGTGPKTRRWVFPLEWLWQSPVRSP